MQLDIKPSEPIEAKYGDKTFMVNRPKVLFFREFKKRVRAANLPDATEDAMDIMLDFCQKVGVPAEILEQWDMREMSLFLEALGQEEKKS